MARAQKAGAVSRSVVAAEIITPFSYQNLPDNLAKEIRDATDRIRARITQQLKEIIATGRDLLQVKSHLEHGQFEDWLDIEFAMTARTAQKYMRAAEWMADKNELSSVLQPTTLYLLSARSTPETVIERVIERFEKTGKVEPEYARMVISEAKQKKWEAEKKKSSKEERLRRKRNPTKRERQLKKELEECERRNAASYAVAKNIATLLAAKLTDDELDQVQKGFGEWSVHKRIPDALSEVRRLPADNVTEFPPKPWESKSRAPRS